MRRGGDATGGRKTKNPFILNGLAVFDAALIAWLRTTV
jgi:hypothetical protein